jgi:hypothetical protein
MGKEKYVKSFPSWRREAGEESNRRLFTDNFTWIQLSWFLSDDSKIF